MAKKSGFIKFLKIMCYLIPGNYLKTLIYLNLVYKPRKYIRLMIHSFYRMDHIYEVIKEFKNKYRGQFSILEFGVADGYSFTKKLYATRYLKMEDRIIVHGFDTFEGMPDTKEKSDKDLVENDGWVKGQFKTSFENLKNYCSENYSNFKFHKGLFSNTLTDEFLETLRDDLPILIWMDADYYSSSKNVFEKLINYIPNGCVIYFDEPEYNYGSRFTGESKLIYKVNHGKFGDGLELILDSELSLNQKRVYRFFNFNNKPMYEKKYKINERSVLHKRTNDSPFP